MKQNINMDDGKRNDMCYNVCRDRDQKCEFNKDEKIVDTEMGGTWIKIGHEWRLYKNGQCMLVVSDSAFRIQQLKLRDSITQLKSEIKKAFLNDVRKVKEFFSRWIRHYK